MIAALVLRRPKGGGPLFTSWQEVFESRKRTFTAKFETAFDAADFWASRHEATISIAAGIFLVGGLFLLLVGMGFGRLPAGGRHPRLSDAESSWDVVTAKEAIEYYNAMAVSSVKMAATATSRCESMTLYAGIAADVEKKLANGRYPDRQSFWTEEVASVATYLGKMLLLVYFGGILVIVVSVIVVSLVFESLCVGIKLTLARLDRSRRVRFNKRSMQQA